MQAAAPAAGGLLYASEGLNRPRSLRAQKECPRASCKPLRRPLSGPLSFLRCCIVLVDIALAATGAAHGKHMPSVLDLRIRVLRLCSVMRSPEMEASTQRLYLLYVLNVAAPDVNLVPV